MTPLDSKSTAMGKDTNKKLRVQLEELRARLATLQDEVQRLQSGHCSACSCPDIAAVAEAVDISIPSPEYEEHPSPGNMENESVVTIDASPSTDSTSPETNRPSSPQPSVQASNRPVDCPNVIDQPIQRRIIVAGDSQARDLARFLCTNPLLANDDVCVFVRPGASFDDVVAMGILAARQSNLQSNDLLVIVAGSNDVGKRTFETSRLAELSSLVNVVIAEVPRRYDLHPRFSKDVSRLNFDLERAAKEHNCLFVAIKAYRNNFTRHGLHYNASGKAKLASCLSSSLNNYQFFPGQV